MDLVLRDLKECAKELDSLAELDPKNYDELVAAASRIEQANPRFKSTEHVLAFVIPSFLQTLSARTRLSYPADEYAKWIGMTSTQFPHPLMLVSAVGYMFKHRKDTTMMLKESSHLPFDPVLAAEAEEEQKVLANGAQGSGTSEPKLGPKLVTSESGPIPRSSARSKPSESREALQYMFQKFLAERG